jgi:anti-sigma factor RsiW
MAAIDDDAVTPPGRAVEGDDSPPVGCRFFHERLHAYVEDELDEATAMFLAAHLDGCAACRDEKRRLEDERIEVLSMLVAAPPPPLRFPERVIAALSIEGRIEAPKLRRSPWRFALGVAVGILLGSLAVSLALRSPDRSPAGAPPETSTRLVSPVEDPPAARPPADDAAPPAAPPAGIDVPHGVDAESESSAVAARPFEEAWDAVRRLHPCSEDLNQDGQTDLSETAHVFNLLAVANLPMSGAVHEEYWTMDCAKLCGYAAGAW